MSIVGSASAYQLYLSCPGLVQVGTPLECSIDSNFPAGTTFDVVMYPPGYTTIPLLSQTVTIQDSHATRYQIFDTTGLSGGQYRVEIQFIGSDEDRLSSDSVTLQLPRLLESPIANFSCLPRTGVAPLTVQFSDNSTGSPTGWAWFFGDENYTQPWTLMNASAGWSRRYTHSSLVMPDGSIVLMGGFDWDFKNDVWRSTDEGATWTEINSSAGWSGRLPTSVVMPDGSIVLMGGGTYSNYKNDTWRSIDNGATWTLMNASGGWSARIGHSSVVMPDGSILLIGGIGNKGAANDLVMNDVWRSIDNGATWMLVNASAGWSGRSFHTSVVMADGSIVLIGGRDDDMNSRNDVWRSIDNGATWMLVNESAGLSPRWGYNGVVMPDDSIVLLGGTNGGSTYYNDIWRSTDEGATWAYMTATVGWSARVGSSSVAMPDGSIVLIGGWDAISNLKNDVWRFMPAGSSAQNPSHTYTSPGTYQVSLQVYNADGYNSTRKAGYINVDVNNGIAIFRPSTGYWYFDYNVDGTVAKSFRYGGSTDQIIVGDWDGDGLDGIAIFRPSTGNWYFDNNLDGIVDQSFRYGGVGDQIIKGNWEGTNDGIAIFRPSTGYWYFDYTLDGVVDKSFRYGGSTDQIIKGDWDGDGKEGIAIFRPSTGYWYFDNNLDGIVNQSFRYGESTDRIIVGNWQGTQDGIAIFRPSTGYWYFDYTLDGVVDKSFRYGGSTDQIIKGDWDGDGKDGIAIFRPSTGYWYFDYALDGVVDKSFRYGGSNDWIIVGNWVPQPTKTITFTRDLTVIPSTTVYIPLLGKVIWKNDDPLKPHGIAAIDAQGAKYFGGLTGVQIPYKKTFEVTFDTIGTFDYKTTFQPEITGRVFVTQ
ncbi:MAG: PKD domain-containing protein [Methanoregula sp.]|nr:PKD domain-containing protein [Methanoregula sp.]